MPYPISTTPSPGGQNRPTEPTTSPLERSTTRRCPNSPSHAGCWSKSPAMTRSPSAGKSSAQSADRVSLRTAVTSAVFQGRRRRRSVASGARGDAGIREEVAEEEVSEEGVGEEGEFTYHSWS